MNALADEAERDFDALWKEKSAVRSAQSAERTSE
jgi:hypothetical protein